MANYQGSTAVTTGVIFPMPGRTFGRKGIQAPDLEAEVNQTGLLIPVRWKPGVVSPPAALASQHQGAFMDLTQGATWFGRTHLLPRTPLALGKFVQAPVLSYEVFNASASPVTLESVSDLSALGLTLPDLPSLPMTIPPFRSILDGASTPLHPVALEVSATVVGPPLFDGTFLFDFDNGEELGLDVTGQRIPIVLAEPDGDVIEHLVFGNAVIPIAGGLEQRIAYRKQPQQVFQVTYNFNIDSPERRRMLNLLFTNVPNVVGLPLWHESTVLSTPVTAGQLVLTMISTAGIDFRVGGYLLVFQDRNTYDFGIITGISGTQVSVQFGLAHSYSPGALIAPLRICLPMVTPQGARPPMGQEQVSIQFQSVDNDTGTPSGSTAGYDSLGGRLFLDTPNILLSGNQPEAWQQPLSVVDNPAGSRYQISDWSSTKHGPLSIGFSAKTRQQVYDLRRLFYALGGRRISFFAPQCSPDLTVTQNLASGASTMTVENDSYVQFVNALNGRALFRIAFTDGTSLVRTILSAVALSATEERLTVDSPWPANRNVSEVVRVDWIDLLRLDSDDIAITHSRLGAATATVPAVVAGDAP